MLRSQCTICTDALTQDLIACPPCGHVYHISCLTTWFTQSKTCPTCRKSCSSSIKLFFNDVPSDEDTGGSNVDIPILKNEIRKNLVLLKEKEVLNKKMKKELNDAKEAVNTISTVLQQELSIKDALKKQVIFLNENVMEMEQNTAELRKTKLQLSQCERIKMLLSGSNHEAQEMLKNVGDGPKTSIELATQLIIMKRENKKMGDGKTKARSEKEKIERECQYFQNELKKQQLECSKLKKNMESLNDQLQDAEQEKQSLKKKLEKIQQSFQSPSPRSSIITRLLQESPAPLGLQMQSPVITSPEDDNDIVFTSERQERVRIFSPKTRAVSTSEKVFSPMIYPGAMRLNRKRTYPHPSTDTGRIRTGYDGLGGHTKILMPAPALRHKKKVSKPVQISRFMRTMERKTDPPLPQM